MRKCLSVLSLAAILLAPESYGGDKNKLKWMAFDEGMAEAQRTGKKVMIDVYTDWCGWCKRMDKDTYADNGVADYLNKKYVAIKLDAESGTALRYRGKSYTEQELAAAFGISGYPSIIFLGHDGEPITVYPGYADADKFKVVLAYIAEDHYKTTKFQDYVKSTE
jgi:thioredoxin-related protein